MAYSDFTTLRQVEKAFNIRHTIASFLAHTTPELPTEKLRFDLQEAAEMPLHASEKAKSELLIMPVLREVRRQSGNFFNIFSGYQFEVNKDLGLTGICDYLFTTHPRTNRIKSPVFCAVEAKSRSVEEGIAQAGAEMIAARFFNERENTPTPVVFGCVTDRKSVV